MLFTRSLRRCPIKGELWNAPSAAKRANATWSMSASVRFRLARGAVHSVIGWKTYQATMMMTAQNPAMTSKPTPCAICGHPDSGHRLVDAILDRYRAGESVEEVADDLRLPAAYVRGVIDGDALLRRLDPDDR